MSTPSTEFPKPVNQFCIKMPGAKEKLLVLHPASTVADFLVAISVGVHAILTTFDRKQISINVEAIEFVSGPNDPTTYEEIYGR